MWTPLYISSGNAPEALVKLNYIWMAKPNLVTREIPNIMLIIF